jgi:hypothetical protein
MAAYRIAAIRAPTSDLFALEKVLGAAFFDGSQILNHAHMVFCAIAHIQRLEAFAGELPALEAETNQTFPQRFASVAHVKAVLAARQTAQTVAPLETPLFQFMLHRQIVDAYCAVHPAGRNQSFLHPRHPSALFSLSIPHIT